MSTQQDINAIRAQRLANTHDPLAVMANTLTPFHPDQSSHITYIQHPQPNNFVQQPSFNTNYMPQPMQNPEDSSDPTTAMNKALALLAKAFKVRHNAVQNDGNEVGQNAVQNPGIQIVENMNGLSVVSKIANQYGNGNVVTAPAEGNGNGINEEEARIQSTQEELEFMADADAYDETERVKVNCTSDDTLQQASTSGTQSDKAPIYDSDGSAEVQPYENCYDNEIFNMFTQEEQYTDLLEPIPEPHQVQQNDSNVISDVPNVEQNGGTVEQCPANVEETRASYDSLYNNLATEVEKVNSVNRKMRATNAELTTELARYKNQEMFFEINQEKYDKLERCYQKSVYQEQCLTKKINALHLSSAKTITTLNEEIANLNNMLSKEKSTVSSLQEEKKRLKTDFKIREDEFLDKQILLENKIKELDNILVKTGKHDPPVVYDSEETLQLAQESRLKIKQLNKEIKPANYTKINHRSGVFVSQSSKSREELYFSNTSKTATVSKSISIPNEDFSDDTTPSVARKFLNEVTSTIVTLQRVVKHRMTLDAHNLSSTAHQEMHKILKDEIFPIVNQVDARLKNFKIQFLKEAAKFVRDFKSLANEADESLDKQKTLEIEIDRLLRAIVSQEIMFIVQNNSVVESSDLQTELERTKERFENSTIKKETEYAKLWNDWYKKCQECKYDKISYDKAYNDMQQTIVRLQAQLGDPKGKCKDTRCVSDTFDPLSQKLENENVELEFQVVNYIREIEHHKTIYKNLFDSISVTWTQTKTLTDSLQTQLHDSIHENAKLRAQLFDKVSGQKNTTKGTSANTMFTKQSILGKPPSSSKRKLYFVTPFPKSKGIPKVGKSNALIKPVTSNSVPITKESKVVTNDKVIALGRFRINPTMNSRVDNFVPNKHVKASVRTKPITVSQPHVITKNDVNSKTNGFSPKDIKSTSRTRRPQPRNNPKKDKVPFKSKSSCLSNNVEKIEENHRNLQSSSNQKHMSSECNNIKIAIRNAKSEVLCAMCKQCLITANHDVCVLNYVNDMNSRKRNQKANVSNIEYQKKQTPQVWKPKKVGSKERLASPKPSTPRSCLRWSLTGRIFDLKGKIIESSESDGGQNWFDTLLIPLLSEYKLKDKEGHGDDECAF
ncbi:hypothetical protein Tco_0321352 [Tanacetum coccineum]